MKLAIIGLGKMGSTLLQGILDTGFYSVDNIIGCDIEVEEKDRNEKYGGIRTTSNNLIGVKAAETILLAVKPQVMSDILLEVVDYTKGKLIISIAAGLSINNLSKQLSSECRIVRVMPNTPALVNEGISAMAGGSGITEKDMIKVKNMLEGIGKVVEIEEKYMDAVTGLSGSGPAYIYMIIEALADGGVLMGLNREIAVKLAAQTVFGSAKMVLETGKHTGELKDMVTSPGGTTIKAVEVLEKGGLRSNLISAVRAATERSKELS